MYNKLVQVRFSIPSTQHSLPFDLHIQEMNVFYFVSYARAKVGMLGRQIDRNSSFVRLAHTSIFGLCYMSVCLMKSNCSLWSIVN